MKYVPHRCIYLSSIVLLNLLLSGYAAQKPNIVLMLADDMSWSDIGCYGSQNARTPHLDKLADDGMRFTNFFNSIAMCAPTRNSLYSGLYPVSCGSYRNHTMSKPGTKSICHYLGDLGYRVGLTGKHHVGPKTSFPFEKVGGWERGCVKPTAASDMKPAKAFMTRNKNQPFCLVIGAVSPHAPWTVGDASAYPLDKLKLPPHWADTKKTRIAYANYCAEVTDLDRQVGQVRTAIDELGIAENTLFLFLSEQGAQFPGAKWTCYDQGLRAGAIAYWPGVVEPGKVSDAVAEYVDVVPTFIKAAAGSPAKALEGKSFLPVLQGKTTSHKTYAFGIHNNNPEGPAYPIRCVRTKRYSYIWNLKHEATYIEKHLTEADNNDYWFSWKRAAKANKSAADAVKRFQHRPEIEFYDLQKDPWEMNNLANNPEYAAVMAEMRAELKGWMKRQNDPGAALDVLPPGKSNTIKKR